MSQLAKKRCDDVASGAADTCIMIVDDHPVVREGFAHFIESEPGMRVCYQSASASEAFRIYCDHRPDVVLVDLILEEGSGIELIKDIVARDPAARLIVISAHDENVYAERCLRAGAMGYVSKQEATEHILDAIGLVMAGDFYLSSHLSSVLLRRVAGHADDEDVDATTSLSDRELEVFELLGRGKSISEIAHHLHLSPKTIETYRAHLKEKLHIGSSQQLARRAFQWVEQAV